MKVALFGGSFDPVHREHIRLAVEAKRELGLDRIIFIPSFRAPHKAAGAVANGDARLKLLEAACSDLDFAETDDLELKAGGTSYTYLTCRAYKKKYPDAELYFLVGADMLLNFFSWKEPEDILKNVTLVACARGEEDVHNIHKPFRERFGKDFLELSFRGEAISSTDLRVALAFCDPDASKALPPRVFDLISEKGLYRYRSIEGALALLTQKRREHSERVARMAAKRARTLAIPEWKAVSASMLHDCGKYIEKTNPMLEKFTVDDDVPAPVLHQYVGAYLAENVFGVTDEDILNAVRFHTSGREDMSPLEKLIFLSDMLEEGRAFDGIGPLREAFWKDLDLCMYLCLKAQLVFLRERNAPIYPLTQQAFDWLKAHMRFE